MKKIVPVALLSLLLLASGGCGEKKDGKGKWPENFDRIGDAGRVAYVMRVASPDSLARFIIYGALGRVPGARIDSLAIATNAAYERLKGDALESFSVEYDNVVGSLTLPDKMKVYSLGGSEDPQGLGYRLGLEYVATIRDNRLKAADVEKELQAFKKACGSDTAMYRRFMVGFKTVLRLDHGKDLPEDIYNKFIDYE